MIRCSRVQFAASNVQESVCVEGVEEPGEHEEDDNDDDAPAHHLRVAWE